ncbi:MAG: MBL fold metallo-hydrolase [Thermomicrobiales bacterium]|nr:MBL fold metallo-hydrolase [Thermomicrobiales bacterium]
MRLTSEIALVGSGAFGFDLTSPGDAHVYLIDGGDELALVDAGCGGTIGDTELILRTAKADGFDLDRISRLLLTHYHFDHMGGAAEMRDRLGLTVHASPLAAKALSEGDETAISLPGARAAGYVPDHYRLNACPAEPSLVEGAKFNVGRLSVTVYETPGHAAGHVSFLVEGGERTTLVQGDVVFHGGTIFLQNVPDCSIQDYATSVRKLAALDFDAFLPGHLAISLRDGKRHVSAAASQFEKLMVPRNLV